MATSRVAKSPPAEGAAPETAGVEAVSVAGLPESNPWQTKPIPPIPVTR